MKDAIGMVVGVVITIVSLVSFIDNTFVPYREQQQFMAESNEGMLNSLRTELEATNGVNIDMAVAVAKSRATADLAGGKTVTVGGTAATTANLNSLMTSARYTRSISGTTVKYEAA